MAALSIAGGALPKTLQQVAQSTPRHVIVILRDQLSNVPPVRGAMASRAAAVSDSQAQLIAQLQQAQPRTIHSFKSINAFAASVSETEAAQLAAHPLVQAVVPDAVIRLPKRSDNPMGAVSGGGATTTPAWSGSGSAGQLCNTLEPEALQLTNSAFIDNSRPQAQRVLDGNGQPVTGKGVRVAFIADGLDTTNPGFTRPDGSSVFIDYQDFSGDPAGTPSGGGEAFGDASSIAAQDMPNGKPLLFDISQFVNAAHPTPSSPCHIRIRGVAPGASLVGLKVFSNLGYTTDSGFVQAIEYAVAEDAVDVINESFGGSPFPDNADDPISLANHAAVQAGVTVVVGTGDAGSAGTLGSPSTDWFVIAAGASTQFRFYAQTGYGAGPLTPSNGYISDNISALSSGGFSQTGARTVDVVAPGDLSWALCSTNETLFYDCTNFNSPPGPTPIQFFGGTSESAPLTSAEAALVIQAYRSTHHGANPSPALIKQIIMSTATDLGALPIEQGAGLINTLAAVNAALSVQDGQGTPKPRGEDVLSSPSSASITGTPNAHETRTFVITNTGSTTQHLEPALQTLGAPVAGATLDLQLDPSTDPTFINSTGAPRSYIKRTFHVPAGAQHLDAAIAWHPNPLAQSGPIVYIGLVDPSGRQAAYSIPQGFNSGYGHVDVVNPVGGTWTAFVWTRPTGGTGSYSGPVQFTWAAENHVKFGSVFPSKFDLAPGASQTLTADFFMPLEPGDLSAAIRFPSKSEIPVTLRTLIPTGRTGGDFTGTLTGGNGRALAGPTETFEFEVPRGVNDMSLTLALADNGYLLEGLLVDPNGMQLSVQENLDPFGDLQYALQLFRSNPQPGRWRFVLLQNFFSSGNQTSLPFTARIGFNTAQVRASGLPNDPSVLLSASGAPVVIPIQVANTGGVTEGYFADARLSTLTVASLAPQPSCAGFTTPTLPGYCAQFYLPTEVHRAQFVAESSAPITMNAYNAAGVNTEEVGNTNSPDVYARQVAPDTVVASLSEPEVPWGAWLAAPALIGPFGPAGAPTTPVATGAFALMKAFDSAVSADSGDAWMDLTLGTNTFNPLLLASGESGTIHVTITPDPSLVGQTVTGHLYIDTFNPYVYTGDEVVRIPYSYTVAP
jgi:hypothetical protein